MHKFMSWKLHNLDLCGFVEVWKRSPTTYLLVEPVRGCRKGLAESKLRFPSDSLMEMNSDGTTCGMLTFESEYIYIYIYIDTDTHTHTTVYKCSGLLTFSK